MAKLLQLRRGTTAENDLFTGAIAELTYDTDKKEVRVHDGSNAGGIIIGTKVGFVCSFAGTTAPDGWLICDGSAVSREDYSQLFSVIGTTYGSGDGSTTFNLPNLSDCFVQGGTSGVEHSAGLPNIKGGLYKRDTPRINPNIGNAYREVAGAVDGYFGNSGAWAYNTIELNASLCSSVYKDDVNTVQPKSVEMLFCIKY